MSESQNRAFISHASEDKSEFAEPLARLLRASGIDAWLDKWEMNPGDSLIQKIFSEGIRDSDAVVVLLSATSVAKPWVQKELNVAAVKNIQNALRLIPVRLDKCDVPEVLTDVLWLDWNRLGGVDGVSRSIIETMHGITSKPLLGDPPPHLTAPRFTIPGLNARDVKVLQIVFEASLDNGLGLLQGNVILPPAEQEGIGFEQVKESIKMLESKGFLTDMDGTLAQRHVIVTLEADQALNLGHFYGYDCEALLRRITASVCNEQSHSLFALFESIDTFPRGLIEAAVKVLVGKGFWRAEGTLDGDLHFHSVAPVAKRWLVENS